MPTQRSDTIHQQRKLCLMLGSTWCPPLQTHTLPVEQPEHQQSDHGGHGRIAEGGPLTSL